MQLELRIAGPKLDYDKLLLVLQQLRVNATVLRGHQLSPDSTDGDVDRAVFLYLFDCDKQRLLQEIWPVLQEQFELTCAYVSSYDRGFHGCILNWANPNRCPLNRASPILEIVAHSAGLSRTIL